MFGCRVSGAFKEIPNTVMVHGKEYPYWRVHPRFYYATSFTWKDLTWLKEQTSLPIIVKGILSGTVIKGAFNLI